MVEALATTWRKDAFGTWVHLARAPSHFPPAVAGRLYRLFGARSVADPFAGWGDRCIAAMALRLRYLGADSNVNLRNPYHASRIRFKIIALAI